MKHMQCGWSRNPWICCAHCLIIVHICFCHSLSFHSQSFPHFFLFLINFSLLHCLFFLPSASLYDCIGSSLFTRGSFISSIIDIIITPCIAPPLTRLNSSPLLPSSLFLAEHLWHPPESLGQSRIHAEHVTSSPDYRQLWGVCLLTT